LGRVVVGKGGRQKGRFCIGLLRTTGTGWGKSVPIILKGKYRAVASRSIDVQAKRMGAKRSAFLQKQRDGIW